MTISSQLPHDVRPGALAARFRGWISANESRLSPLFLPRVGYDVRVESARELRRLLFEEGWGRLGWPVEFGGLGGTVVLGSAMDHHTRLETPLDFLL